MNNLFSKLQLLGSELILGSLIAILSVLTALAGYQASMADSEQTTKNVQGQQRLTDANAEYLTANQLIVYDYTLYDGYFTAQPGTEQEEYYRSSFSDTLKADMAAGVDLFSDSYYESMYAEANAMFQEADDLFAKAQEWNKRGDALQLVMLIMALGLAFAAWASLLKEESRMRILFAFFSIAMLVYGLITYLAVPSVAG
ncbi:MAG: hypothetical protein Fur0016_05450 [Anaerolineales bacterium]